MSRTFHFGVKGGTSQNQFGENLSNIRLNQDVINWSDIDISNLEVNTYDSLYFSQISMAQPVKHLAEALETTLTRNARLEYHRFNEFQALASGLKIMKDEKAGIPRTAYRGVVEVRPHGEFTLFLIPPFEQLKSNFGISASS